MTKDYALALQDKILKYKLTIEENYYKLAKLAKTFLDEQLYLDLGFSKPEDWAKEVLGYGVRKLQYLIGIEAKFEACGVSDDDREAIEWTKARQVVRVLTSENVTEWIEKARTLTVKELHNEIAGEKAARNIQDYKPLGRKCISYYTIEQQKTIEGAFEMAAKTTGSNRLDVQLEAICQEFTSTYTPYSEAIEDPVTREVFERDGYKCRVPWCGKRYNLDRHEIVSRARGGKVEASNCITLCREHHDDVTNEKVKIEPVEGGKWRFIKKAGR